MIRSMDDEDSDLNENIYFDTILTQWFAGSKPESNSSQNQLNTNQRFKE